MNSRIQEILNTLQGYVDQLSQNEERYHLTIISLKNSIGHLKNEDYKKYDIYPNGYPDTNTYED